MLQTYMFCPQRFKKVYIDKIRDAPTSQMVVGTRFHNFAETFFDHCDDIAVDQWKYLVPSEFNTHEQEMVNWFVNNEMERYFKCRQLDATWQPLYREIKLRSENLLLSSIIDRVDLIPGTEDKVEIIEYKTGLSTNKTSIRRELAFYGILFEDLYGDNYQVGSYRVINPNLRTDIPFKDLSRTIPSVYKNIDKLRDAISTGIFNPVCTDNKFAACKKCTPEEAGIFYDGK